VAIWANIGAFVGVYSTMAVQLRCSEETFIAAVAWVESFPRPFFLARDGEPVGYRRRVFKIRGMKGCCGSTAIWRLENFLKFWEVRTFKFMIR
jgi:hypothetical protein